VGSRLRGLVGIAVLAATAAVGVVVGAVVFKEHETHHVVESRTETIVVTVGDNAKPDQRAPLPSSLSGAFDPHALPLQDAVPADANVLAAYYLEAANGLRPEVAVTWRRDFTARHPFPDFGLVVWERVRGLVAVWRRSYAWSIETTKLTEINGIRVSVGDFTGDGHPDLLLAEDTDGSAGGASYVAIALFPAHSRALWHRDLAMDEGTIALAQGAIKVTEGFDRYDRGIHCCFRKVRVRWLRWNGERMAVVRALERRNRQGWPPG
jgi:FG-GAP repeat